MDSEKPTPKELWRLIEKVSRQWTPFFGPVLYPQGHLERPSSTVQIQCDPRHPLRATATIEIVWPLEIIKRDFLRELKRVRGKRDRIRPNIDYNAVCFAVWLVRENNMHPADVALHMFDNRAKRSLVQHWVNRIDRALRTTRLPKLNYVYSRWLRECAKQYKKDFDTVVERIKSRA
jgi:hypothetical protein